MSVPEPPDYIANDELAVVAWCNAYTEERVRRREEKTLKQ
jgi:hypothetical protein